MSHTKKFFADPLKIAQAYALAPVDDIDGYVGKRITDIDMQDYRGLTTTNTPVDSVEYARVQRGRQVATIKIRKEKARPLQSNEGRDVLRVSGTFDCDADGQPAYFLPWDAKGAIVRLTIPPKGTRRGLDPDIFFTAAINGCSVFVQGDPKSPTVYHAGGGTGRSNHNDAANFWRTALSRCMQSYATARARGKFGADVDKTDYIKTMGTPGNATTPLADQYERELKQRLDRNGKCTVLMVNPWGCVFGVRSGDEWAFYLQENATVVVDYVKRPLIGKPTQHRVQYARPMRLTKIFPGGRSGIATMNHSVPPSFS